MKSMHKLIASISLVLLFLLWSLMFSSNYFEDAKHVVLGMHPSVKHIIEFWFYWNSMPAVLVMVLLIAINFRSDE